MFCACQLHTQGIYCSHKSVTPRHCKVQKFCLGNEKKNESILFDKPEWQNTAPEMIQD